MQRILLVEDEMLNMAVLSEYMRQAGYQVDEAVDGAIAWEKLVQNQDYALVVTDRNMPNMDGLTLFGQMQKRAELRRIPVIMQSAADSPQDVVDGINAGVYYYLTKPYEKESLLTLVKTAIRERVQHELFETKLEKQRGALGTLAKGEFHVRTPEEAQDIAFLLGSVFPRPDHAAFGLYELVLNSIEHGNLGLGYEKKREALLNSAWEKTVTDLLKQPEIAKKKVVVEFTRHENKIEVIITDEGEGFDPRPFMEIEPSRATESNGRGIAKANLLSFDTLEFLGIGNKLRATTALA